jgi:hypothetical protein
LNPTLKAAIIRTLFPKRIGRLSFLLRLSIWVVLPLIAVVIGDSFSKPATEASAGFSTFTFVVVCSIMLCHFGYFLLYILRPRFADIGFPSSALALILVPMLNALVFYAAIFASSGWWQRNQEKMRSQRS